MGIFDKAYERKQKMLYELRNKALKDARAISSVLGKKYGAKKVILFGSLAEEKYFDKASDIDIAVKGFSDNYYGACAYCVGLSRFKIDIRLYEEMPLKLKQKIDTNGRILYG